MKKKLFICVLALLSISKTFCQTQVENGNFETWENEGSDSQEPIEWSSLKTSDDDSWLNLANQAPQVIWKETTDPHSGNACLRLTVADFNILANLSPNAIATNGRVFASTDAEDAYVLSDNSNTQWNTACADKPDSLVGWYKYAPLSGDKGKIEVLFHNSDELGRLPDNGTVSHHIGNGIIEFTVTQATWKRFSFPITYNSSSDPTSFLIVTTAGDELDAVSGSELLLDDMSFIYNPEIETSTSLNEVELPFTIFSYSNIINLNLLNEFNQVDFNLYALDGKKVFQTNDINSSNALTTDLNSGIYIYHITIDNRTYSGKISLR